MLQVVKNIIGTGGKILSSWKLDANTQRNIVWVVESGSIESGILQLRIQQLVYTFVKPEDEPVWKRIKDEGMLSESEYNIQPSLKNPLEYTIFRVADSVSSRLMKGNDEDSPSLLKTYRVSGFGDISWIQHGREIQLAQTIYHNGVMITQARFEGRDIILLDAKGNEIIRTQLEETLKAA